MAAASLCLSNGAVGDRDRGGSVRQAPPHIHHRQCNRGAVLDGKRTGKYSANKLKPVLRRSNHCLSLRCGDHHRAV
jgi:hypothetical protein